MKKALYPILFAMMVLPIAGCKTSGKSNSKSIEEIWKKDITECGLMDKNSNVTIAATSGSDLFLTLIDNGKYKCENPYSVEYYQYVSGTYPGIYTFDYYSNKDNYQKRQVEFYLPEMIDLCGLIPLPYEAMTYDKTNDQYVADKVTMHMAGDWTLTVADVTVKFENSKLKRMTYKQVYEESQEKGDNCVIELNNYGSTKVTLP